MKLDIPNDTNTMQIRETLEGDKYDRFVGLDPGLKLFVAGIALEYPEGKETEYQFVLILN